MAELESSLARAVVCVPARNEADTLPRLLRSLDRQKGVRDGARLRVIVVANNCTDSTVETLKALSARSELVHIELRVLEVTIPSEQAHVGTARRRALDAGMDWLDRDGVKNGVLLSTDADAIAPENWVISNMRALQTAELVGGRLVINSDLATEDPRLNQIHAEIERYWYAVRQLEEVLDPPFHDPAPRHGDHVAASLSLGADLYRRVGGLPTLPYGEDNALVSRVRWFGGRVRHCPDVWISVSDRGVGRVIGGMATEMIRRSRVADGREAYLLPDANHWRTLIQRRQKLAQCFDDPVRMVPALKAFGLSQDDVASLDLVECPNAIALVERVEAAIGEGIPPAVPVPLEIALANLEKMLAELRSLSDPRMS